ncbi:WYL domain-containing protein [Phormidesmis priestleyi]|uniref:WYL domain-containing protein n=1 Tax=Phormidesmis priestleyi TaxID=268141 RepID=UPI001E61F193|nr:WYL domain-containing protein [Phormidesmis priestleyi]
MYVQKVMGRKGQSITLPVSEQDKAQLEAIAREQGMLWGERPNISRLMEAIAHRELLIGRNNGWSETRIKALQQSIQALIDAGHPDSAQIIIQLLLERSELPNLLRSEFERSLNKTLAPWRLEVDQYIRLQTPFQLTYQDAAERSWGFTIRHAKIVSYERRQYLECWCEETEGSRELPELQHNWTLRIDRILDAALSPISGQWRSNLDELEVEIHLLRGLAFAYESKTSDIHNEWLSDRDPPVRRVVRKVSNTFWFFREVFRYGEDCIIVAPEAVKSGFRQKLQLLYEYYGLLEMRS